MNNFPSVKEQIDVFSKGIDEIIPIEDFEQKLEKSIKTSRPLRIKFGCDPSKPDLHIGHAVLLRKLRQFQDFGHQAILIIGDFTAMIGDPSGKNKSRPQLTLDETISNAKTYIDQAEIILSKSNLEIVSNNKWLGAMNFNDIIKLSSYYTVAQMLERDDFTKRYKNGVKISLHEFLYPLAQGYDSVVIKSDVELGGTDQKFNLLVGRAIQKEYGQEPQIIITAPLLEGIDGVEKMSKSSNNYIALTDSADEMYGKTLSIPDELIVKYFELCTDTSDENLKKVSKQMKDPKVNPRDIKRTLALEIATMYHDKESALLAEKNFDNLFIKKGVPEDIQIYKLEKEKRLIEVIVESGMVNSSGEGKRLIKQGAVKINESKISDMNHLFHPNKEYILKVGKRRFLKIQ